MRSIRIAFVVALGLVPVAAFAQAQRAAIASSDVLSQISMFNYQGKSSLELRPTPIAANGEVTKSTPVSASARPWCQSVLISI